MKFFYVTNTIFFFIKKTIIFLLERLRYFLLECHMLKLNNTSRFVIAGEIYKHTYIDIVVYDIISFDEGWITDISGYGRNTTRGPTNSTIAVTGGGFSRADRLPSGGAFLENLFNGFGLIQHGIYPPKPIELGTSAHVLLQRLLLFPTPLRQITPISLTL